VCTQGREHIPLSREGDEPIVSTRVAMDTQESMSEHAALEVFLRFNSYELDAPVQDADSGERAFLLRHASSPEDAPAAIDDHQTMAAKRN
jgi:hypothetical protein